VEIPEPIRAAAGLAATVFDQARQLPTAITGLPVRVAGIAMQTSLRLQQRYAGLVVKGDELLIQISRSDDADPPWATFDDDVVDLADAVTEEVGVDVTVADDASSTAAAEVALPPLPGTTRSRPPRKASSPKTCHPHQRSARPPQTRPCQLNWTPPTVIRRRPGQLRYRAMTRLPSPN
jgi:hypothetical protein